jgi:hypothetical protein
MVESLNTNIAFEAMIDILWLKHFASLTIPLLILIYFVLSSLFLLLLYKPGSLRAVATKLMAGVDTIIILTTLPKV